MDLAMCLFNYFPHGGLQRDFLKIAKQAIEEGHRVTAYLMSWEGAVPEKLRLVLLPRKGKTSYRRCWNFSKVLEEELAQAQHDCVLGFNRLSGLDFYFAGDVCFQAYAYEKWPMLFRALPRYRTFIRLEKTVFNAKGTTKILLLNPRQQAVFRHYYHTPDSRFHLIPPGIKMPTEILTQAAAREALALDLPRNAKWLLMVAADLKLKGLERNLRALKHCPPDVFLLVVGGGRVKKFAELAYRLGVQDRVRFLGIRDDIDTLMQASDILVHPAHQEAAGMVLIEALMNQLPVLVTDNCGYAFHIADAKAGELVAGKPFSEQEYIEKLLMMLNNFSTQSYQQNAKAYVASHDLSSMAEKVVSLLKGYKDCRAD